MEMPGRLAARVRASTAQPATFVELFFDLVFVYAVTQLTSFLVHDLTWPGAGKALLIFWLVWWAWTQFTWTLNLADTENVLVRILTLAATAVAFFLAQAVPDAFAVAGAWFAVGYAMVRLIGLGLQAWVTGREERAGMTLWGLLSLSGITLVIVGGFADPRTRIWLWMAALAADLATAVLAGRYRWVLEAGHFTERHGLIVIIALGESLIATGLASAEVERGATFTLTITGAVVVTCALWWTYFGTLHPGLEERMAHEDDVTRGSFARDVFSFWHAPVIAGIIAIAVAFEEAIAHLDDPLEPGAALALTLGLASFLGGLAIAAARAGVVGAAAPRALGAVLALAATPLAPRVTAPVALWGLAVMVVAMDLIEVAASRDRATNN